MKLAEALSRAKKPLVLAGAGVLFSKATDELKEFVEKFQLPVVNTLLGLGSFPGSHSLSLGMGGIHGSYIAIMAVYYFYLLINICYSLDEQIDENLINFRHH